MANRKVYIVTNAKGYFYAGQSSITGEAMWFDGGYDIVGDACACRAVRWRKSAAWLAQALKSDATAKWSEY